MNRRHFMEAGVALGAWLAAGPAWAAWPQGAFEAEEPASVVEQLASGKPEHSDAIRIKAPEIAENGAVVPISVSADLEQVSKISIVVDKNPLPLTSTYELSANAVPYVSTRVKMLKTSDVLVLVEAGGKTYANKREVKVTIGGCGG